MRYKSKHTLTNEIYFLTFLFSFSFLIITSLVRLLLALDEWNRESYTVLCKREDRGLLL